MRKINYKGETKVLRTEQLTLDLTKNTQQGRGWPRPNPHNYELTGEGLSCGAKLHRQPLSSLRKGETSSPQAWELARKVQRARGTDQHPIQGLQGGGRDPCYPGQCLPSRKCWSLWRRGAGAVPWSAAP